MFIECDPTYRGLNQSNIVIVGAECLTSFSKKIAEQLPIPGIRALDLDNVYLEKYFQRIIDEMITQLVEFGLPCWLLVLFGTLIFIVLVNYVSRWYLIGSVFLLMVGILYYLE